MQDNQIQVLARQFKGLWIPAAIIERTDLQAVDKMLWADIDSFSGNSATWFKSRERAAKELGVSERTVTRCLAKLIAANLIRQTSFDGRVKHYVSTLPSQFVQTDETISPSRPDSVSSQPSQNVSIDNSIDKQPRKQPRVVRPTLDEVITYFDLKGGVDGAKFFDHFESTGWVRNGGVKIKDWKAAARNWMRNESKFNAPTAQRRANQKGSGFTAPGVIDFIANG